MIADALHPMPGALKIPGVQVARGGGVHPLSGNGMKNVRLRARSRDGEFTSLCVREIHKRTVNLEKMDSGRRYSIVTSEEDFGPRTVLADSLPAASRGEDISLVLEGVPVWYDPSLPAGRMSDRWIPLVREWGTFLEDDLELLTAPAHARRFEELLGLGPGSTPAGDDFLAGYASGSLWLGASPLPVLDLARTTWLSGEILKDAMGGLVWKRSRGMLEALASDDADAVTKSTARILDWGHSSGRAWLAGLSAAVLDSIEGMKGG